MPTILFPLYWFGRKIQPRILVEIAEKKQIKRFSKGPVALRALQADRPFKNYALARVLFSYGGLTACAQDGKLVFEFCQSRLASFNPFAFGVDVPYIRCDAIL